MLQKNDFVFVNVIGNIGAGATTLSKNLCSSLGWTHSKSKGHTSPFLQMFYNTGKFGFQNQVYIITESFKNLHFLNLTKSVCQDYCFYEHQEVYSKLMLKDGYLTNIEFLTLKKLTDACSKNIRKPDLLIYLQCDPSEAKRRIKKRNRPSEKNVKLNYLESLDNQLEGFVKKFKLCHVMKVDSTILDVRKKKTTLTIINQIQDYLYK